MTARLLLRRRRRAMLGRLHKYAERRMLAFIVGILLTVSAGGLAQILPMMFAPPGATRPPLQTLYSAAELAGRSVYVRESCGLCHSQQIRPLLAETRRYGPASLPEEFVYDRPFLWGSKRTGPDLARVGGKYSDAWHRLHLVRPRAVVPSSIMPGYPWLENQKADPAAAQTQMLWLRRLGAPYTDADIANAAREVEGLSDMDTLIAYLQSLGRRADVESDSDSDNAKSAAVLQVNMQTETQMRLALQSRADSNLLNSKSESESKAERRR